MILALALVAPALATDAFDPASPVAVYTGDEVYTQDGAIQLWSSVELHRDGGDLFRQEAFNDATRWVDGEYTPHIATMFGDDTPPSGDFLLHAGVNEPIASGTPILLVGGAGDNASRGFVTLATRLDRNLRPVYALTFAHPHGDMYLQAEVVADAIAVIEARTGAEQVDLVGHSKGGIAAALYAAHAEGLDWGDDLYETEGTWYRGDVRRLVLIATPLGGIDTAFRWPAMNLTALEADTALSPTSWTRYYPFGTLSPLVFDELADQDFAPDGADLFPGQRQLLQRQDHPLPGSLQWLGNYALQPDWYTTYEGGLGFVSDSAGIDAAVADGGFLIGRLETHGIDPDVPVWLLAGEHPVMPNASEDLAELFASAGDADDWTDLLAELNAHDIPVSVGDGELAGLDSGALVLGEVSGPSDGLVFVDSATREAALTARGAEVVESRVVALSHLDVLYASPITGELLIEAAAADPELAWMADVGQRYVEADTLGWVESVLADPDSGGADPSDTATDGASGADDYAVGDGYRPCGGCATTPGGTAWLWLAVAGLVRRRR